MNRVRAASLGVLAVAIGPAAFATAASAQDEPAIDRVLVTGLKPAGLEAEPGGQMFEPADDVNGTLPSLGDFLERNAAGVTISTPQGNPFQPELSYRGYSVSGLLGLPQGLAFYQNGARINEAFGDVVNFDLVPEVAVDEISIASGANPLFGLNALGGAVSATMKTGFTFDRAGLGVEGGSFGRILTSAEAGGNDGATAFYVAGSFFEEDGWRDHSPSELTQLYGDLARRFDGAEIGLSVTYADSDLNGNGAAPVDLLAVDREAVFTYPDNTQNELTFIQARGDFDLSDTLRLETGAHHRRFRQNTLNGDETDLDECEDDDELLCLEDGEGELAEDLGGDPIEADDVGEEPFGVYNRSSTESDSSGVTAQLVYRADMALLKELTVGASYETAETKFANGAEIGALTEDRTVEGADIFLGGDEFNTGLHSDADYWGAYVGAAFGLTDRLSLETSARYNRAEIDLDDQLGTALDGSHSFDRLNPAVELTYDLPTAGGDLTFFGRYAESSRTPTPAELSCADETQPCRFPNAFVADPPLNQVVAKSWEGGITGVESLGGGILDWSATLFTATNEDDIVFVSSGPVVGSGYFRNAGDTQRQGLESWARWESDAWTFTASYSYIDATFEAPLTLLAEDNPNADDDGEIFVEPGDRLPLIPQHSGQASAEWRFMDNLSANILALAASDRRLRGDEAGEGATLDGFVRVDAGLAASLGRRLTAFVRVENVLDEEYSTFGTYGDVEELYLQEAPDAEDPRFFTPSAPRAVFAGFRLKL